ncbi:MAG: hypothetical protein HDR25_03120 [Lachnospiraceae bacterium]|nr:hypothetical protein [Lachnospiraceae bacterium]
MKKEDVFIDNRVMKNKKTFGLYGTNRRKAAAKRKKYRADEYTEEMYEDYDYEYDEDAKEYDEDDAYLVEYSAEDTYYEDEESVEDAYYEGEEFAEDTYDEETSEDVYAQEEYYEENELTQEAIEEAYAQEEYYEENELTQEAAQEAYAQEEYYEENELTQEAAQEAYEQEVYAEESEVPQEAYAEEEAYYIEDYAEDTGSYYEEDDVYDTEQEEDYESEEYADEYAEEYDEDSFDTSYGGIDNRYNDDYDSGYEEYDDGGDVIYGTDFAAKMQGLLLGLKERMADMTAFDAILVTTGVVLLVAVLVICSMFFTNKRVNGQIEAIAPIGTELAGIGIVGENGLSAMADAALLGNFDSEAQDNVPTDITAEGSKVNVSFVSVEKDLKIRFTDAESGELITGTKFEVKLTNTKTKNELVLTDDDMDGIIYAENIKAGTFDAVVTSTDKYKFPTLAQTVTVKDKVDYVVINVQDEVKSEKQVNVAAEDTQKNDAAAEEVKLADTVEWVESTKTEIGGSETYLPVDKNTIPDPSTLSKAAARMLFDTINVTLDKSSLTLKVGTTANLSGTSFKNSTDNNVEYQYTTEWSSSNESVATVNGGAVTAKSAGTATITYTVTRKTITTTYDPEQPIEETKQIDPEDYDNLSDAEKQKCTPIKDDANQTIAYEYKKVIEPEKKVSETTDTASASCEVRVEELKISGASLELSASRQSCPVGETITVKPSKLVYTKDDNSKETITDGFPTVTWSSSDSSVAEISADGIVTGKKAGTAVITGQINGITGADGRALDIKAQVNVSITAENVLKVTLDRTEGVYIAAGSTTTLTATVSNYTSDAGVTWETSDKKVATVNEKGVVTGVAAGSATITAVTKEKDASGNPAKASCVVTVNSNASGDTTTKLKDANGNQIYIKNNDGSYKDAVFADYYTTVEFYIKTAAQYKYTGWQTIDGKTYFFDKNGNPVTGAQVIQGVAYNFGSDGAIATTVNGSKFGIDVSRHNGEINWNAVKASGVDYVIIRCGYRGSSTGALIQDQNFNKNIQGATAAGLKVGIYVFSQAVNEVEAVKEASLAVACAKGYNLTYPIFIDTESSGGRADKIDKATRTAVVNAFCQTVANSGYKAGIYASKTWFEDRLNMGAIGNYRIWLAQYAAAPTYKSKYDMWQYSSKGKISGINGNVDLNWSYLGY